MRQEATLLREQMQIVKEDIKKVCQVLVLFQSHFAAMDTAGGEGDWSVHADVGGTGCCEGPYAELIGGITGG